MPTTALRSFDDCDQLAMDSVINRLNAKANELKVSASTLMWRLVSLGRLTETTENAAPEAALRNNGGENISTPPLLISRLFVEVMEMVIDQGKLSARHAAKLVGLPTHELRELFADHGIDCSIDR